MIRYTDSLAGVAPRHLRGFFVGWPNPPSPETHLRILRSSAAIVLAVDDATRQVVGFVNALSDGFYNAFIPHLEVLPTYQARGIGTELMRRILSLLAGHYAIDLMCDPEVQPFYERVGMRRATGMYLRDLARQPGA